ncbi:MAG: hypothetical protein DRI48_11475 [Chloroflexi bacterium]|nr:MAG: hypothetical protein DRI48_11475 [Chloroflexota bacterium]
MLVRQMTPAQRERLLDLAPDLRRDALARAKEQAELADYFEDRMREVLSDEFIYSQPLEEEFIGPYTLDEFCALLEDEQVRLWDQAHAQAWEELSDVEYPTRSDVVSARKDVVRLTVVGLG